MKQKSCHFKENKLTSYSYIIASTLLGSILAAHGLMANDLTTLIPSMLISPIGSLLIDVSSYSHFNVVPYTYIVNSICIIFILTILMGYILSKINNIFNYYKLPSKYMIKKLKKKDLIIGAIIACVCAFAFPYAIVNNVTELLISIGIATALLPPLVVVGLFLGINKNIKDLWVPIVLLIINASFLYLGITFSLYYYC